MTTITSKKPMSKQQTFSGVVTKAEIRSYPAHDSGRYGSEINDIKAMIAFRDDAGNEYWFYSPAARQSISTSGPYSVATIQPTDWITKELWTCEGFAGARGIGSTPTLRVKVGDQITIKAKIKSDTRYGKQLWYVKRTDFSLDSEMTSWRKRLDAAMSKQTVERIEFPLTPHAEIQQVQASLPAIPDGWFWRICGGPEGLYFADAEMKDAEAFIAWFEGVPVEMCRKPE